MLSVTHNALKKKRERKNDNTLSISIKEVRGGTSSNTDLASFRTVLTSLFLTD